MEYMVKQAVRMEEALFAGRWNKNDQKVRYLIFYRQDWDSEVSCKIRLGNRRFITLNHVVEENIEVVFFQMNGDEKPTYVYESLELKKKGPELFFDAVKYLQDMGVDFWPADKDAYDSAVHEFRRYSNDNVNDINRAVVTKGGFLYWTYYWTDWSSYGLDVFYANPVKDKNGKIRYHDGYFWRSEVEEEQKRQMEEQALRKIMN